VLDLDAFFPQLSRWAEQIGAAVWIRDPQGYLCHVNAHGEALLGRARPDWAGKPCHEVVGSCDEHGDPFCGPNCLVTRQARAGAQIHPVEVQVRAMHDGAHWVRLLIVPFTFDATGGSWLMHCAVSTDREHRMREFLVRVADRAMRSATESTLDRHSPPFRRHRREGKRLTALTPRERQVLDLLAEDRTLPVIAHELGLSHVTVRNHVQHVLRKLGVHSILEAVAVRLVESSDHSEPM
jgi:DNA-binding CsgD family transcriptional regulator